MYKERIHTASAGYPFLIHHLNVKYIPHFHEEVELVYVLEGELQLTLGNTVHTIKQGDISIILPNCIHNLFTHEYSRTFVIKILPTAAFNTVRLETTIFSDGSPIHEELKESLLNMAWEDEHKQCGYELAVNRNAADILLTILRKIEHYTIGSTAKSLLNHESDFLMQVDLFLQENPADDITLEKIAQKFHYTKSYFCRYFKKITGITFWQYYTLHRLEKSIELLKTNVKINMTQIAMNAGFKNVRSFNKAFQSVYRCTPTEYRHMMMEKQASANVMQRNT